MSIKVGDRIPSASVATLADGMQQIDTAEFFASRKMVLFSVPGAFTPTCSQKHLPGYIQRIQDFRDRGIEVACMAVNDPFVMDAWARSQDAPDDLHMLADGNGEFARALGLEMDGTGFGMGLRAQRFALYADNGEVKQLQVEAPGEFKVSSADAMLETIG